MDFSAALEGSIQSGIAFAPVKPVCSQLWFAHSSGLACRRMMETSTYPTSKAGPNQPIARTLLSVLA
jgi:hypothetical protein